MMANKIKVVRLAEPTLLIQSSYHPSFPLFNPSHSSHIPFVPSINTPPMGAIEILSLALTHPNEFRILLQFWNFYLPKRDITKKEEHASSGWDRPTMRRCWELLDHSSRSFSAVIKELDGDLARVVSFPFQSRRFVYHRWYPT